MPVFAVDIEKLLGDERWTNRYLLESETLAAANQVGLTIVEREKDIHYNTVQIVALRTRDTDPSTSVFITTPLQQVGSRGLNNSQVLPLFNCARVDFPAGQGRPSRKYYRGCLTELDINGGNIDFSSVGTVFDTMLGFMAVLPLVDPQGAPLQEGVLMPRVQMRQLRRGSKRKTVSIISPTPTP